MVAVIGDKDLATKYLLGAEYLKNFAEFAKKPTDKVFMPYESSAALGSLGIIKELFEKEGKGLG